ncbi:MAG: hypothetical protein ACRDCI_05475, partial [Plesiomonas shigelloides]
MAQVLSSFLVGIGMDTREFNKGQKEVERGLVNIRSSALTAGAAVVGVFGSSIAIAAGVNKMNVATQGLRASVADIETFGAALRTVGGNSEQALADLTALDKMAAQMRVGQFDVTGLIKWGVTGDEIARLREAAGPMEQMQILADIVPRLEPMNRNMVMGELGISNESMVLLAKGQQDYNKALADAQAAINTSVMPQLIEQSAQFTDQMGQLQNTMIGIGNTMATAVLPGMNDFLGRLDDLAKEVAPAAEQAATVFNRNTDSVAAMAAGAALTFTPLAPAGWALMASGAGVMAGNELDYAASQGKLTPWGDQANPYTLNGSWFRDESNHRENQIRQMQQNATSAQAYQAMGGGGR